MPSCSVQGEDPCGRDAVCEGGFCLSDPAPVLALVADRPEARIGEVVRLDAGASLGKSPGELLLRFEADPADAVEIVPVEGEDRLADLRFISSHRDVRVSAVATSGRGRVFRDEVEILFVNSSPVASLSERISAQPGETVELFVEASDPDGDPLRFEWILEEGEGELEVDGPLALLQVDEEGEDAAYQVRVVVRDDRGGRTDASARISSRNRAPRIRAGPTIRTDHRCIASPAACMATAELRPSIEDVGPLSIAWRLIDEGEEQGLEAIFEPANSPTPTVTLRCAPFCKIAGSHRIEVTATDGWGAASTSQLELLVENRPPVVFAHDDEELSPSFAGVEEGVNLYRIERPLGGFLSFYDPDGDPIDPASVRWFASAGELELDPADPAASAAWAATGAAPSLRGVEISVMAADVYGAAASDRREIPLRVIPPSLVRFDDGLEGGHSHDKDAKDTVRKTLPAGALEVSNPSGLPYHEVVDFDPADEEAAARGARVEGGPGKWSIAGSWEIFEVDYLLRARIWTDWGHEESATAAWRVSNHRPRLVPVEPESLDFRFEATETESCCGVDGCAEVGLGWSPSAPLTEVGAISGAIRVLPEDDDEITVLMVPAFEASLGNWEVGEVIPFLRELPVELECDPHFMGGVCELVWAFPGGGCGASVVGASGAFTLVAIDPHGEWSDPIQIRIELE